jgi:hypothetical protein
VPAADVVEHARHAHDHRGDQDDEAENDKHDTLPIFALYPVNSEFESSQRRARTWPGRIQVTPRSAPYRAVSKVAAEVPVTEGLRCAGSGTRLGS